MTPPGLGLPSLATMLFKCPIRGILPIISRPPIGDEEHYEVLVNRQTKYDENQGTPWNFVSILTASTVVVQCEEGDHGPMELQKEEVTITIMKDPITYTLQREDT